jgi:hypothetical protein
VIDAILQFGDTQNAKDSEMKEWYPGMNLKRAS